MTVAELREKLAELPDDLTVCVDGLGCGAVELYVVSSVEVRRGRGPEAGVVALDEEEGQQFAVLTA